MKREFEEMYMIEVNEEKFNLLFERYKRELESQKDMELDLLTNQDRYWIYDKIRRSGEI